MDELLRLLYEDTVNDHSKHPRNFGPLADATNVEEGINPLCGDKVKVYLKLDTQNRIAGITFEGKGCAISQASASLMTETLMGRTVDEVNKVMDGFVHLVTGEESELAGDDRDRLDPLEGVKSFPNRIKCATLAWHTMKSALEGGEAAKSE